MELIMTNLFDMEESGRDLAENLESSHLLDQELR